MLVALNLRFVFSFTGQRFGFRFASSQTESLIIHYHRLRKAPNPAKRTLTEGVARCSMAETEDVVSSAAAIAAEDEDGKHGFTRTEMYQSNLAGTVDPYDRHLFLCFKSPNAWLPRVENSETDPLPKLLASALKARKNDITAQTKLTICEGTKGSEFGDGDVLVFPEMIKYKGLKDSDVDGFVDDVLVNGKPWASGKQEVLSGAHIFVCSHASRDKRCGVCGPILIENLNNGIESRGLKDKVFVRACSHVGGHKYAGNLIVFSPDSEGRILGSWYGYVTPGDIPEILDQHIGKGIVLERILRGQMVSVTEGVKEVSEEKLPNGIDVNESSTEIGRDNVSGCCQGANGFSCCRDESPEINKKEALNNTGSGKLSSWIRSWDQSDVLAAVAIVGAVSTVAVAYSLYKRSG